MCTEWTAVRVRTRVKQALIGAWHMRAGDEGVLCDAGAGARRGAGVHAGRGASAGALRAAGYL